MCLELLLGVKLSALSLILSGVFGLGVSNGTVLPLVRPSNGVFGLAFMLREPVSEDLCARSGEDLDFEDATVSVAGAELGRKSSLSGVPMPCFISIVRTVEMFVPITAGLDGSEAEGNGSVSCNPAFTQGRTVYL